MALVNTLTMFQLAVANMPKAKEFYADTLGLAVKTDYRQDDDNWWVSLSTPAENVTITLTTHHGAMKPGTMTMYFQASDVIATHDELAAKGVAVQPVQDDLYGPGSGVKFFQLTDPDGNLIHIAAA